MRFSDLMGSGAEREPKRNDSSQSAIDDAIAPYLEDRTDSVVPAPAESVVEPVEVVAASEPTAALAPDLPAPPAPPTAVASFDIAEAIEPEPPRRAWQPDRPVPTPVATAAAPVVVSAPTAPASALAVADFTPLSDDLLPRRR